MKALHIFRAGTHQANNGRIVTLGETDVAAIATAYDPAKHEAPIVVGHPKQDDPAYGWVERLTAKGDGLYADVRDVDPAFSETVRAGRYRKVSVSLYTPDTVGNPTPGVWSLRHVGFLGATPPAVKGLKSVQLDDGANESVCLGDPPVDAMTDAREALFRRRENERFVEARIAEGRLLPAQRALVIDLLERMPEVGFVSLGEGQAAVLETPAAAFRRLFETFPKVVEYRELVRGEDEASFADVAGPEGFVADARSMETYRRARAYAQANGVDYPTAVRAVSASAG